VIVIPVETVGHREDMVFVILDAEGFERIRQYDPAEVVPRQCPGCNLIDPTIIVCFDDGSEAFKKALETHDVRTVGRYLSKGFRYRPHDRGDHDRGPEPYDGGPTK
jgi:hypothetical protein